MAKSGVAGELSNWSETALWKMLKEKGSAESASVVATLNNSMPDIQRVLAQGGTAQTDFTLHDSQHSFRVAERMASLIPSDVLPKLSTYEWALLILSAYLHDIGMTPEQHKVSKTEIDELQEWLDDAGYDIVPPLSKNPTSPDILRLANELITHYCRFRHNDWSESWIRKNLAGQKLATYMNWIDDLVVLCRSHHEDYHDLIEGRFNPRFVGTPASMVHLRYLAVALRVADILEFDPERTPEVILRHRKISPGSLIYWWKDHYISIVQENNRLLVSARPENAQFHHAIETMVNDIDRELQLSRMLADVTHFEKCPGLTNDLPHRWDLVASVHRDIKPEEDTYEYIDGAFRPDTKRLLELLSGVELYGTPFAAVRELLQNAFDAVKEQIAHQRLAQMNPTGPQLERKLADLHRVDLKFERLADGYSLTCTDTGVGMTKAIIRDHLLVSGAAQRHDILELERRCKEKGFLLGRTGQFGIGVLSYFMLAERVSILTRRAQEPGDSDGNAWSFETEGVGYFGELRAEANRQIGTEVRLHLRSELVGDNPESWYQKFVEYLQGILIHLPCQLSLQSNLSACPKIQFNAGWVLQRAGIETIMSEDFESAAEERSIRSKEITPLHLLPSTKLQEYEDKERHIEEVSSEMLGCLRWLSREGQLPNDLGHFRFHLPYFELHGGKSLAFLRCIKQTDHNEVIINRIGEGYAYVPRLDGYRRPSYQSAWKGVRVGHQNRSRSGVIVEINWQSPAAGKIKVSRDEFVFSDIGKKALEWLDQTIGSVIQTFLHSNEKSLYARLSYAINYREGASTKGPLNWLHVERIAGSNDLRASWKPVSFPAISSTAFMYSKIPDRPILWRKKRVCTIRSVGGPKDDDHYDGIAWNRSTTRPDRVVALDEFGGTSLVALWTRRTDARPSVVVPGYVCSFPPKWKTLCGVTFERFFGANGGRTFWNPRHRVLRAVDEAGAQWCKDRFETTLDPRSAKDTLLANQSYAAAWVIFVIEKRERDIWEGLVEREPQFLLSVWQLLFGVNHKLNSEPVCFWVEERHQSRLHVVSPISWQVYGGGGYGESSEENQAIRRYLPNPGPEWRLRFEGRDQYTDLLKMARRTKTAMRYVKRQ
jgi:hypothetical protein